MPVALSEKLARPFWSNLCPHPPPETFMPTLPAAEFGCRGHNGDRHRIKLPPENRPRLMEMGLLVGSRSKSSGSRRWRPGRNQSPRYKLT